VDGGAEGDRQEAMAWMMSGFSAHFPTDAFAGRHLISGNVGRTAGLAFFEANEWDITHRLAVAIQSEKAPYMPVEMIEEQLSDPMSLLGAWKSKVGSIMLKLVHDHLNNTGVEVKNALGTAWRTKGDAQLYTSPETKVQGELATEAARDAVQQTLDTGGCAEPFKALDYIPDVARLEGQDFRPIAEFAEDVEGVFKPLLRQTTLESNEFYDLLGAYMPALPGLIGGKFTGFVKDKWRRVTRSVGAAWDWAREKAADLAGSVNEGAVSTGDWVVDKAGRASAAASGAAEWAGEAISGAASSAWHWITGTATSAAETGREATHTAKGFFKNLGQKAMGIGLDLWKSVKSLASRVEGGAREGVAEGLDALDEAKKAMRDRPGELESSTGDVARVSNQVYAHGAFMGAAGRMMQDDRWRSIFQTVMPDSYAHAIGCPARFDDRMITYRHLSLMAAFAAALLVAGCGGAGSTPGSHSNTLPHAQLVERPMRSAAPTATARVSSFAMARPPSRSGTGTSPSSTG